jgi:maltose alpha-D-glucosyltransferase/alpha-amylase
MTRSARAPRLAPAESAMPTLRGIAHDPLWYKDAIVYQVHVRAFFDSDDDGIGDFVGLTRKLDYIQSLGVSCIWLLPFYPSPLRDDGYDIAHYEGVHPSYGTRRDFSHFLDQAHARGLRVITELVINHTSDQHPWFQAARRARPGSTKRDYYVWSDTDQKYQGTRIIFTDTERSNWTWDPVANAYYWHRFFHHQPDLNFDNPRVRRAVLRVMKFWLDMGVDGLRLDAVPYLIEREGTSCENLEETHEVLREIRRELDARYSDRMLLAEANQWPSDVAAYFGAGDECHMAFHFPLMPRLFMALRQEDRHPITEILTQTPDIPSSCQWAIFLRNHDELTLEMVTDEERDYMYQAYAADPQMRINVGIRRRLAPLMEYSRPRVELLNGLLLSLPGTPIVYYGDEIGMGDNIYLGDRNGVRTPMQWTADRNAGFSRADPARLFAPVIMDPVTGYQGLNVESQERSPHSLLNWMRRIIAMRQQHRTFGRGTMEFVRPHNRRVFGFVRRLDGENPILVVANLSRTMQAASFDLSRFAGLLPVEMSGGTELPRIGDAPLFLTLGPYAFYWIELKRDAPAPITARPVLPAIEAPEQSPLLVGPEWTLVLSGNSRRLLETRYVEPFLRRQRWFTKRPEPLAAAQIADWGLVRRGAEPFWLSIWLAKHADGTEERYGVPLVLLRHDRDVVRAAPEMIVAPVAGARKGAIMAAVEPSAARELFDGIAGERTWQLKHGRASCVRTAAFDVLMELTPNPDLTPTSARSDQSNTSILFGERFILKLVRHLWHGINPELEIGRFLTEQTQFRNVPRLAGAIEYHEAGGGVSTLAVLHEQVFHRADGWRHALTDLEHFFDRTLTWDVPRDGTPTLADSWSTEIPDVAWATIGGYLKSAAMLGRRTAELHLALNGPAAAEALGVGVQDRAGTEATAGVVVDEAAETFDALAKTLPALPGPVEELARRLIDRRAEVIARTRAAAAAVPGTLRTSRIHGDYHLGQVLLGEEDFTIVDFEGEPTRTIEERRRHQSPMKDIAGMLRSFHYAAGAAVVSRAGTAATPAGGERLATWARWWQAWTTASFLSSYRATAGEAEFLPADRLGRSALLELFLIEKALYEIRYELTHRPQWLAIPVQGLLDLVAHRE